MVHAIDAHELASTRFDGRAGPPVDLRSRNLGAGLRLPPAVDLKTGTIVRLADLPDGQSVGEHGKCTRELAQVDQALHSPAVVGRMTLSDPRKSVWTGKLHCQVGPSSIGHIRIPHVERKR